MARNTALRSGLQPVRTIQGPVKDPVAAVLPEFEPDRAPMAAEPTTSTSTGPPRILPTSEFRIVRIFWIRPVRSIT